MGNRSTGPAVDFAQWPFVVLRLNDETDGVTMIGALEAALRREQPFALAIAAPERWLDAPSEGERGNWLRRNRAEVGTWCRGVAYVLPTAALAGKDRRLQEAARIWGCPTKVTDRLEDALGWSRELLAR